jgi:hypothetical protein
MPIMLSIKEKAGSLARQRPIDGLSHLIVMMAENEQLLFLRRFSWETLRASTSASPETGQCCPDRVQTPLTP